MRYPQVGFCCFAVASAKLQSTTKLLLRTAAPIAAGFLARWIEKMPLRAVSHSSVEVSQIQRGIFLLTSHRGIFAHRLPRSEQPEALNVNIRFSFSTETILRFNGKLLGLISTAPQSPEHSSQTPHGLRAQTPVNESQTVDCKLHPSSSRSGSSTGIGIEGLEAPGVLSELYFKGLSMKLITPDGKLGVCDLFWDSFSTDFHASASL